MTPARAAQCEVQRLEGAIKSLRTDLTAAQRRLREALVKRPNPKPSRVEWANPKVKCPCGLYSFRLNDDFTRQSKDGRLHSVLFCNKKAERAA